MRRFMLLAVAVALAAPIVVAQTPVFSNVALASVDVAPGSWVLAQRITQAASGTFTVTMVRVFNTASGTRLAGADVERIEVRRSSDSMLLGSVSVSTALANFATAGGVEISTTTNNVLTAPFDLEVWVRLKASTPLGRKLQLGTTGTPTVITTNLTNHNVGYTTVAAATFTTAGPIWFIDGITDEVPVYREQKFLAARFEVNNLLVGASRTVSRVDVRNRSDPIRLAGAYIARIEVIRARDGNRLGERTSGFGNFPSDTLWVDIATASHNAVGAYSLEIYEIWITLRSDAPTAHRLQLGAQVRLTGTGYDDTHLVRGTAPRFIIGEPQGLEQVVNSALADGRIFSGQRFLAQRIEVRDSDLDPYSVTIESFVVQNVADLGVRLPETQIARVEVRRARDGVLLGEVTGAAGLNAGGVRIPPAGTAIRNNIVADDTSEAIEIWITLAPGVPHDRTAMLRTTVWHTEGGRLFQPVVPGNATFTTGPEAGDGFETATPETIPPRTVFQGVRFLAQRLALGDNDADPYDVTITSLMIRNYVPDNPLADHHVARVEVRRRADGALLGEVTDPVGLSLAGVRVATTANNVVPDDTSVELEIWVTLKDTTPTGRKLRLESVVWHTEGTATHQTSPHVGPALFTTAISHAPTGVDFTWTPTAPEAGVDVTFTPAAGIADPSGDIANATFHWAFGDGRTTQTGSAPVRHTYAIGGTFPVTLTVTGEGGLASARTRPVVVIGKQPVVDFNFAPDTPSIGQEVAFTSQVTDPATPPLTPYTYGWTFGDGGTSTDANPRHTYAAAGTYTVVLSVTNARGETGTRERTITVVAVVNRPPIVTALAVSPLAPEVGQKVTFTATANDPDGERITGYEWDFGDETGAETEPNTGTHTFTASNVFQVRARARDAVGFGDWFTLDVYVRPRGGALIGTRLLDNPARTQCRIQLFLPVGAAEVQIQIFDMLGREVRREPVVGGQFTWDLRDGAGGPIADGLYFYLITATVGDRTERSEVGRILVLR